MSTGDFLVLFACFWWNIRCAEAEDPVVVTRVGKIRGMRATDGDYSMFLGIPYAVVDSARPFGKSTPYPVFNEPFNAVNDSAVCPQEYKTTGEILGSLDCLQLFIYTPHTNSSSDLPVFVFIHGGAFVQGFGGRKLYGPKYLMAHDIIVVTFNYRLGPYGFLCLDIPEVSGNQGLKDQLIALRWIKNNIAAFRGDPNNIILAGESAGGFSVHLHLISDKEILYNKLIIQSGMRTLTTDIITEPDNSVVFQIAQYLGWDTTDIYEALSFLTNSSTNSVIEATTKLDINSKLCKERKFDSSEVFITKSSLYSNVTKIKDIPVLIGFMRDEMAIDKKNTSDLDENLKFISRRLNQKVNCSVETMDILKTIIGHFYFGDAGSKGNLTLDVIRFDSDFTYIYEIQKLVDKYLRDGAQNVFYYQFSYSSKHSFWPGFASHADDLFYLFDVTFGTPAAAKLTYEDKLIIKRITTMWSNYAKYGDPTPETTDLLPVKWLPVTSEIYYFLNIDTELSLDSRPFHDKMAFWDIFFRLIEKYDDCVVIS